MANYDNHVPFTITTDFGLERLLDQIKMTFRSPINRHKLILVYIILTTYMSIVSCQSESITNATTSVPIVLSSPEPPQPPKTSNYVTFVDTKMRENSQRHHTSYYRQMGHHEILSTIGPSVVLRRGDYLQLSIHFRRPLDQQFDKIRVEAYFGSSPQVGKETLIYFPLKIIDQNQILDKTKWLANITMIKSNSLQIDARIWVPVNCPVGVWRLKLSTKLLNSKEIFTYTIRDSFYVIFNPWSREDSVYMSRDDARNEYVLNEVGKVYMGSYQFPTGTRWNYGQFSEYVLPGMMMLLDRTRLDVAQRADIVKVTRAISATMNSHDDMGLLVGNWSGNYLDGTSPWHWSNSATIFEKYVRSGGRPVKFGQCWVFGGITTTALRALGIPARTITNFISAHDTDLSLTVDQFNSEKGEKMNGINGDSIWNFHVWSDAWMMRDDLPLEFSGWQAIDATPQETSMGIYQLGPASIEAVKQGKVTFAYDIGFVFSEVNADVVHWRYDARYPFQWKRTLTQTDHVGRKILTKHIGLMDHSRYGANDAEDITSQYKYREGSREERQIYNEAFKLAGLDLLNHNTA